MQIEETGRENYKNTPIGNGKNGIEHITFIFKIKGDLEPTIHRY